MEALSPNSDPSSLSLNFEGDRTELKSQVEKCRGLLRKVNIHNFMLRGLIDKL